MLQAGEIAPDFSIPNPDLQTVSLSAFRGRNHVVVYFYPKDDTPGCTIEALEFTELKAEFDALATVVLGVSKDNCVSHGTFRDRHGLTVDLLADVDGQVCDAYGVWQERIAPRGDKQMSIVRSTFVIDKQGVIRHALYDVKPKGHAAGILDLIRSL